MPDLCHDGPDGAARFDELNAATQSGQRRKVRHGDYTLYADSSGDFRLFDLSLDPFELDDRWLDPGLAPVREQLLSDLALWQLRAEDPLPVVDGGHRQKVAPHDYRFRTG